MNIYAEDPDKFRTHCQHYFHDYNCDDHCLNGTDCSTCEFRHRTFLELSDVLNVITDPVLKEQINSLQKYNTF